jgi:uncharacterized membrane protein YecN with MAPEG domain
MDDRNGEFSMILPVTSLFAGLAAILVIGLAARIPPMRRRFRVGIHSGQNEALARAIRVHGNAVEYVPLGLLLLGLLEIQSVGAAWLYSLGGVLMAGRLLHAFGLGRSAAYSLGRFWGTALTWLSILTMAGMLLWLAFSNSL